MPRKGNPQHKARKRVMRDRAKAAHAAGWMRKVEARRNSRTFNLIRKGQPMTWLRFKIAVALIDVALWLMPEVVAGGDDVYGRIVRALKAPHALDDFLKK